MEDKKPFSYTLDFKGKKALVSAVYTNEVGNIDVGIEIDLVEILKIAASKTDNKIDDTIVKLVDKALD